MTVFVNKGDDYLTPMQLEKRAQKYITRSWPAQEREKSIRSGDGRFDAFIEIFSQNHIINKTNNTFNWHLQEYKKSVERLSKYILSEGRPSETFEYKTGIYDDEGNEIIETYSTEANEVLSLEIEVDVYDEISGEKTGIEMLPNPLIVKDEEERLAAQEIIDATPQDVKDFYK